MRKFFRISLYILLGILGLLLSAGIFLMTPPGKKVVRNVTVNYMEKKLKTKVVIKDLDYRIPSNLSLNGVLLIDRNNDTLFRVNELNLDIQMLRLLNNQLKIEDLYIEGLYANIYRPKPDTAFNFEFLVEAFASVDTAAQTKDQDTSATSILYEADNISLKNISFIFNDQSGGTYFDLSLDTLNLRPKELDPTKMLFTLNNLYIDKLKSNFRSFESILPDEQEDTAKASPLLLNAEKLSLHDINFNMLGEVDSFYLDLILGNLEGNLQNFDLLKKQILVKNIYLDSTFNVITMGKGQEKKEEIIKDEKLDPSDTLDWVVVSDEIRLKQVNFKMDDNTVGRLGSGIDYSHLDAENINLLANNLFYTSDSISGSIDHISLKEQSGLILQDFRTVFNYHDKGATLSDLYIKTPNSVIRDNIAVRYNSLEEVQRDPGSIFMNINFKDSRVAINDVLIFIPPGSKSSLTPYAGQNINMSGNIKGYLRQLELDNFYLKGLNNTEIFLSGTLNGLLDMNRFYYNLNISRLNTTLNDLRPFIPKETVAQLNLPNNINIAGRIQGNMYEYRPDNLRVNTSDGNVILNGMFAINPNNSSGKYNLNFQTESLNLGKILRKQNQLGLVTMNGTAIGSGFDPKYMNADIHGNVARFDYNNYSYSDVRLKANVAKQIIDLTLNSNDPNANLDLVARIDLSNKNPAINSVITLNQLNPYRLGFVNDTLLLGGTINLNFSDLNPDRPVGVLSWAKPYVYLNSQTLELDSIYVVSEPEGTQQNIYANLAGILEANLEGEVPLTKVGDAFINKINNYFRITDSVKNNMAFYDFSIIATAKYHPLISNFVPDLKPFDSINLATNISNTAFALDLNAPFIEYGSNRLDTVVVAMDDTVDNRLVYNIYSGSYRNLPDGMTVYNVNAAGNLKNDSVIANVTTTDSNKVENYAVGALAYRESDLFYASLLPKLRVYYDMWNVAPNNLSAFGNQGFYVNNLEIFNNDESIKINSQQPSVFNSPLAVLINNFRLQNVTKIFSNDTVLIADGILGTNAIVDLSDSFPKINADLSILDLEAYGQKIGRLNAKADNENANTYNAFINLFENENDIQVSGQYHIQPVNGNNLDFKADLRSINLAAFEGLSQGHIKESSGFLTGLLNITGKADEPNVDGYLETNELKTKVSMLNNKFLFPKERIDFENGRIRFNDFKMVDSLNNMGIINGYATTNDYKEYDLNLNLSADRWLIMNSTAQDYEEMFGTVIMSADLKVNGSATAPYVSGNVTLHDSTNFTYAQTDAGPGTIDHEGVVAFVNTLDSVQFTFDTSIAGIKNRVQNMMQLNLNVATEKHALFNVLIDPLSGDNLQVGGEANLNASMTPSGTLALAGTYIITEGFYELNINFLRRKFEILEGSTIQLSGDPLDAEVNIKAGYDAVISPYDLVTNQVQDPAQLVYYKQRLPFQIQLTITGKPLKPNIKFDIIIPENGTQYVSRDVANVVETKLRLLRADVAEMNKQVFAVLVAGRFVGENPFESGASTSMEFYARQSAARFISDQMNKLTSNLINGVDLALDLQSSEDYSSGARQNRTDLNIQASKKLLDDRLTVTLGNDFQLEGRQLPGRENALIPGNIMLDYRLAKDGRYSVNAYRKNQLQNIIDGFIVETGTGFKLNYEYNKFSQIFKTRAANKEVKRINKKVDEQQEQKDSANTSKPVVFMTLPSDK